MTAPAPRPSTLASPPISPAAAPEGWSIPLWLRQVVPAAAIAYLSYLTLGPVKDPDTFWHLRIGKELPSTWQFSGPDPWNSVATRKWTLHEWLPELVMGQFDAWGRLPAVAVLMVIASAALMWTLFTLARHFTSLLMSGLLLVVSFVAMLPSLALRPQLVSFALAALTVAAWLRTSADRRVRWWLIPMAWVWACCHGMWFIGVIIGTCAVLGMLLDRDLRALASRGALVPLGSLVVASLTPGGFDIVTAPLTMHGYTRYVSEWDPPSVLSPPTLCAVALLVVPLFRWARSTNRAGSVEVLLVLLTAGVTMSYARTVALGAAMAVPLAAMAIGDFPLPREHRTRREIAVVGLLSLLAVVGSAARAPSEARDPGGVPTSFSSVLSDLPNNTVVCNDYDLGGWLLWRHPKVRPIIDGRAEIYDLSYVASAANWQKAGPNWRDFVVKSGCSIAILRTDSAITFDMRDELGWREVSTQDEWSLLVEP